MSKKLIFSVSAVIAAIGMPCYAQQKPNVIIILVDDMGYSDIGCYGGEILTPNIDALSSVSMRFTQFYNTSRSCPARASLLTGLFQHETGIGQMSEDPGSKTRNHNGIDSNDWGVDGYKGYLNRKCVTIAEVLKDAGYHTYMSGKWHLGMHGQEKWPLQRGFERYYGILAGACNYFKPSGGRGLTEDNTRLPVPQAPYYTTDAFGDHAIKYLSEQKDDKPFFLYLAFNAPHWPLMAKDEDIVKFKELYRSKGWDIIRQERYDRMIKMGIIDPNQGFAEWENRTWNQLSEKEKDESAYRMAVYAAQVHCMDYNVGKLIDWLKKNNKFNNTLIFFLSDNGACAEPYEELGGGKMEDINKGYPFPSYGRAWAQTSNTPFRKYKCRSYEGGISTPLIVSWQNKLGDCKGELCKVPAYLPDIMPTILEATGTKYPKVYKNQTIYPLVGKSLFPALEKKTESLHKYMYWEHEGNRAIRYGDWKAVLDEKGLVWELYNIKNDRTERHNLASKNPSMLNKLIKKWDVWAKENFVLPKHLQSNTTNK
jgi:arylsulfatase A-like enzyme